MRKLLVIVAILVLGGLGWYGTRDWWMPKGQASKGPAAPRAVSVTVASAEKKPVPVQLEAIGTVQPIATVALKSRIETTIQQVHFEDGAHVKQGDVLFTLDSRQLDALIAQAEGTLAKDQAQLEGNERDVRRLSELIAKGATTQVNLDNAKTQGDLLRGTIRADKSIIESLNIQKSYTVIRAPISGRIGAANFKAGNFVRPADTTPLAVINQIAPVYVAFSVPQRALPELREAMGEGASQVTAAMPGTGKSESGTVAMIENTVDPTTGMVMVRAAMDNRAETLWPGTLVNVTLTIRKENVVVVPSVAVQRGQAGSFVFVVKDNVAHSQPVKVSRTLEGLSVVSEGLTGTETIVTDGQLLLSNGTRVQPRGVSKAGA
jgi:RND family efflux transporter MFP subunit